MSSPATGGAPTTPGRRWFRSRSKTADGLDLKVGDSVTVNVLGRNITARIANLRAVDWQNLGINFVLVFSPGAFAGAPHTDIATLTFTDGGTPAQETALLKALARTLSRGYRGARQGRNRSRGPSHRQPAARRARRERGGLIAAALVLGGALAAGQRFRIYDAVVLKTLGATRGRLIAAYALEYLLLGLATALFGVAAGSLAAGLVVTRVMEVPFVFVPAQAAGAAGAALLVTVVLGLLGTFTALDRKPAEVLRNL